MCSGGYVVICCHQRTHSVVHIVLSSQITRSEVYQVWVSTNDRCATPAVFFTLRKRSKQRSIKQNAADARLCVHKDKNPSQTLSLFEDPGEIGAVAWIRQKDREQHDAKSDLTGSYLKGCASWTDVIGQVPRTPCSPLSMVLHLRRQQWGIEVLLGDCSYTV